MTLYTVLYDDNRPADTFTKLTAAKAALKKALGKGRIETLYLDLPDDCAF